jgi:RimJ/RimL family protein N-acetyltransferase
VHTSAEIDLIGSEVSLTSLEESHVAALTAAARESRDRYGFTFVPDGEDATRRYVEKALAGRARGDRIPFVVAWRSRIVGTTSYWYPKSYDWPEGSPLRRIGRPDSVEIGATWLAASAQRTRCNTEAKLLLLEHAFDAWGVHRVAFRTDERNEGSRRAILRVGAKFEGIQRAEMQASDGGVRSSAFYSIIAPEWPAVRERLKALLAPAPVRS